MTNMKCSSSGKKSFLSSKRDEKICKIEVSRWKQLKNNYNKFFMYIEENNVEIFNFQTQI